MPGSRGMPKPSRSACAPIPGHALRAARGRRPKAKRPPARARRPPRPQHPTPGRRSAAGKVPSRHPRRIPLLRLLAEPPSDAAPRRLGGVAWHTLARAVPSGRSDFCAFRWLPTPGRLAGQLAAAADHPPGARHPDSKQRLRAPIHPFVPRRPRLARLHDLELRGEFFERLFSWDEAIAERVAAEGCRHCGGPQHQSSDERKPRGGLIAGAGEAFSMRHSLGCGREGCRKRALPPSLRFLGRRAYLEAVVLLAVRARPPIEGRSSGRERRLVPFGATFPQGLVSAFGERAESAESARATKPPAPVLVEAARRTPHFD